MSEQKHTPGPWYSADDDHCHIRRDSDDAVIAEVFEDDGHCDPVHCRPLPSRANARLFAAAPELLEALDNVLEIVRPKGERMCDCERCDCHNQGDAERVAAWDERYTIYERAKEAAAIAIAKATGGAS